MKEYRVKCGPTVVIHISEAINDIAQAADPNVDTINGPKPLTAPFTVYLCRSVNVIVEQRTPYAAAIIRATSQILISSAASRI